MATFTERPLASLPLNISLLPSPWGRNLPLHRASWGWSALASLGLLGLCTAGWRGSNYWELLAPDSSSPCLHGLEDSVVSLMVSLHSHVLPKRQGVKLSHYSDRRPFKGVIDTLISPASLDLLSLYRKQQFWRWHGIGNKIFTSQSKWY